MKTALVGIEPGLQGLINKMSGSQAKKGPATRSRGSQHEEQPESESSMEEEEKDVECAEDS